MANSILFQKIQHFNEIIKNAPFMKSMNILDNSNYSLYLPSKKLKGLFMNNYSFLKNE